MTVDKAFAALGDTTRLELVRRLARGPASVSELAAPHDMSLRGVLKHVQVLEDAGLVRTVKSGRVRRCELQRAQLDKATRWLEQTRRLWERRLDRLEEYITKEGEDGK